MGQGAAQDHRTPEHVFEGDGNGCTLRGRKRSLRLRCCASPLQRELVLTACGRTHHQHVAHSLNHRHLSQSNSNNWWFGYWGLCDYAVHLCCRTSSQRLQCRRPDRLKAPASLLVACGALRGWPHLQRIPATICNSMHHCAQIRIVLTLLHGWGHCWRRMHEHTLQHHDRYICFSQHYTVSDVLVTPCWAQTRPPRWPPRPGVPRVPQKPLRVPQSPTHRRCATRTCAHTRTRLGLAFSFCSERSKRHASG